MKLYQLKGNSKDRFLILAANRVVSSGLVLQDARSWLRTQSPNARAADIALALDSAPVLETIYDPKKPHGIQAPQDGQVFLEYNRFQAAPWRQSTFKPPGEEYNGHIQAFMEHFFNGNMAAIESMYDWMGVSLRGERNIIIPCLIGGQRTGKGTFSQIAAGLLNPIEGAAHKNVYEARENSFEGNFNSQIADRLLVIWNEAFIDYQHAPKVEANLKRYADDNISIEGKGQVERNIKNYASIMLISNDRESINVSPDQQRFYLMDTTSQELAKSDYWRARQHLTGGDLNAFIKKYLLSQEALYYFGYSLLMRKYNRMTALPADAATSANQLEALLNDLKGWELTFITSSRVQHAKEGDVISLSECHEIIGFDRGSRNAGPLPQRSRTMTALCRKTKALYEGQQKLGFPLPLLEYDPVLRVFTIVKPALNVGVTSARAATLKKLTIQNLN
jgi:hypothetical protein